MTKQTGGNNHISKINVIPVLHIFFSNRGTNNRFFLLAGYKVDFMPRAGQTKSFSNPLVKKNRVRQGKNIYFTRVVATIDTIDYFSLQGTIKTTLCPASKK